MIRPHDVVAAIALALVLTPSCTKRSEPERATIPTGQPVCRGCDGIEPVTWGFAGVYRDSACKRPVVQALHNACTPLSVPANGAELTVSIFERFRGHRGLSQKLTLSAREVVGPKDSLYVLRDGACRPQEGGPKRLPSGCKSGDLVCRTTSGGLGCGACAKLPNGCEDLEGVMAYVEVAP